MRRIGFLSLPFVVMLAAAGCGQAAGPHSDIASAPAAAPAADASRPAQRAETAKYSAAGFAGPAGASGSTDVSLDDANKAQSAAEAFNRKIIRNADITLEVEDPSAAQQKIAAIAESRGGFVVTSEISQAGAGGPSVSITMRVPADRFGEALEALHAAGSRVVREKITGQDVTEEYIDLEARIRTKQALEAQFLEIMKQAKTVADALQVQSQLSDVRGEIEQLEGRRRFLENQSSLSTVNVTLQTPSPVIATTTDGFGYHIRRAFGDSVDTASSIIIGVIRLLGVGIPVLLLIVLPVYLLVRMLWWRARRRMAERHAPPPFVPPPPPAAETGMP